MALATGGAVPAWAAVSAGVVLLARLADTTGGVAPSTSAQPAAGSGQGPEWGEAAPIGLLIILLMGGALFLLMKSMNRNLRRVPDSFEGTVAEPDGTAAALRAPAAGSDGISTPEGADGVVAEDRPHRGGTSAGVAGDDGGAPAP